ncbi:collectrin [Petromyzon marinus]|uniref:collectrin n=1 Tax=Petromyzon marinus TaxID=7757 RepID=UPI003F72CAA5
MGGLRVRLLANCFVLAALSLRVSSLCTSFFNETDGPMCGNICKDTSVKVRISLKKQLGENAYVWDDSELFLFRSAVAYAMRKSPEQHDAFTTEHVIVCAKTKRISFYFAVMNPKLTHTLVEKQQLVRAIRLSRPRMNRAFMLDVRTLEFVGIKPTLAPTRSAFKNAWLVAYGVVSGASVLAIIALFADAWRKRYRQRRSLKPEATNYPADELPTETSGTTQHNGDAFTAL